MQQRCRNSRFTPKRIAFKRKHVYGVDTNKRTNDESQFLRLPEILVRAWLRLECIDLISQVALKCVQG